MSVDEPHIGHFVKKIWVSKYQNPNYIFDAIRNSVNIHYLILYKRFH